MAAKLLHSLTDDNPDLQKQIGCMTGVFQLFDRHDIVAGRRYPGHSPKRLPPGSPQFDDGTPESESSSTYQRPYMVEKHTNKIVQQDKHRASTESSRDSFSSMSRSSSFSSVDCNLNRTTHPESDQLETPSRDSAVRQSCGSQSISRQSIDLRDVVKESMYREARGISQNKSTTKDEASDHVVAYREAQDALAKFQEVNWYYNEPRELSRSKSYQFRDGSSFSVPKDCPRFSYDGRETNRLSFQSRDNAKPTTSKQPEELPRLSLESLNSDLKANLLTRNPKTDSVVSVDRGPIQARPPSVVAKLMGLETLPDSASASHKELSMSRIRTGPAEDVTPLSKSSKATDLFGPIKMHNSSRSSLREPTSPCWKNSDMKPSSRFPIEPAPWKQRDGARSPQKPGIKSPTRMHSPYSSVYSEVDKRLKHLEFTQSGKDLRALKQILEAMQSMEARKEGTQVLVKRHPIASQTERFSERGRLQGDHQNPSLATRGSNHLRAYESPIVIMKPANLVERSGGMGASSAMHIEKFPIDNRKVFTNSKVDRDLNPRSTRRENAVNTSDVRAGGRHTRSAPVPTKQQQLTKENTTTSGKSSGSISPRLQPKRLELERRSRPPTPPPDSSKQRKQSTKQLSELSSPGGRRRPKYSNIQQSGGEVDNESKKFGYRETQVSHEFNYDMASKIDTSPELSEEIDNRQSPSSTQEKSTLLQREDESLGPEYPSPVSVLDDAVYMDDSPSPVKHMLKGNTTQETKNKDEWEAPENVFPDTLCSGVTCEINRKKLQNIEHLVQKLTRLNSSHDEAHTDYIASLCENTKPDDRYISEILLASGLLLRDLGSSLTSFQFHSSGHPINPELFLVLEQTKFSNMPKQESATLKKEKFHRKLIFDTVNEVLAGKLALVVETWSRKPFTLMKKRLNTQKLLRDLCLEIEELQVRRKSLEEEDDDLKSILWEEVLNRAESWTDYDGELPVIALEVERLIFKDLVNEVVLGEACDGRRIKPGRRCRQLFSK